MFLDMDGALLVRLQRTAARVSLATYLSSCIDCRFISMGRWYSLVGEHSKRSMLFSRLTGLPRPLSMAASLESVRTSLCFWNWIRAC